MLMGSFKPSNHSMIIRFSVVLDGVSRPLGLNPDIECFYCPNQGFSGAVNIGLAALQCRGFSHVLLLNDDALLSQSFELMQHAIRDDVGAIGPRLVEGTRISYGYTLSKWRGIQPLLRPGQPHALSGACLLVPSWVRLNPIFPHGIEDIDLCMRLQALDLNIVCVSEAVCNHQGGKTLSVNDPYRQRASVFGQLHLFWHWPVVILLNCLQILRKKVIQRYKVYFRFC